MHIRLGEQAERCIATYDEKTGHFEGDRCPTEIPVLEMWYTLARAMGARTIVETGTHKGLSTVYLAAAIRDGSGTGKVHTIDPKQISHLWECTDLEPFIRWYPLGTQKAFDEMQDLGQIDVLVIDSIHTYAQCGWEIQHFEPLVKEGGLILCHDSLLHDGVGRAVAHLYESGRFEVCTVDTPRKNHFDTIDGRVVSCGLTIARKIKRGAPIVLDPEWLPRGEAKPIGPLPFIRQRLLEGRTR